MHHAAALDTDVYRRRAPYRRPRHRRPSLTNRICDRLASSVLLVPFAGALTAAALALAAYAAHGAPVPTL